MVHHPLPQPEEREVRSLSPEARRQEAVTLRGRVAKRVGPGTYFFQVLKRTAVGTFNDGFIHAGNLAYLAMLTERGVKPLSRWEGAWDPAAEVVLRDLGLHCRVAA